MATDIIKFEVKGLEALTQGLLSAPEIAYPILRKYMGRALAVIRGRVRTYPPATIANSPDNPKGHWYERGYGPRWKRADGSIAGAQTSEVLGKQWAQEVRQLDDGVLGIVGNSASYSEEVQGENQEPWHAAHGWLPLPRAVEDSKADIENILGDAVEEFWTMLGQRYGGK